MFYADRKLLYDYKSLKDNSLKFTEEAKKDLCLGGSTKYFHDKYGDYYVDGEQYGAQI